MTALILAAQLVAAAPCLPPQPAPGFVCQDGGWLPPNHPAIRPPQPPPAPTPPPAGAIVLPLDSFRVGRTYRRDTTGTEIYITAITATKNGTAVYAAECLNEGAQDQCFFPGEGRFILATANTLGWAEIP